MKRKYSLLVILGALVAIAAILIGSLWAASVPPPTQTQRLPDGTVLSLDAVSFGLQEQVRGTTWQRMLHTMLPAPMKDRSGARVVRGQRPNGITFHLLSQPQEPPLLQSGNLWVTTFDEHDHEAGSKRLYAYGQGGHYALDFPAFPRRGEKLGIRFYRQAGQQWTRVAEFTAPNPAQGRHPEWQAPPLPQTQQAGDLQVTLRKLVAGAVPKSGPLQEGPAESSWYVLYDVTRGGKPATDWSGSVRSVSDATGNSWNPNVMMYIDEPDGGRGLYFNGALWPEEEVVQVRLQLARTPTAAFAPNELWTVRNIPLPARGKVLPLSKQGTAGGVSLELLHAVGVGGTLPPDTSLSSRLEHPSVLLQVPANPNQELVRSILRAVDDQGRKVQAQPRTSTGDSLRTLELIELETLPGARSVTLTFAVQKMRFVEFLAPKELAPDARTPR